MGWQKRIRKVKHPEFMAGKLFDVWFLPYGNKSHRQKICVTTDPEGIREWAYAVLDARVRELCSGNLLARGMKSRVEVTNRPEGEVIWSIRFGG